MLLIFLTQNPYSVYRNIPHLKSLKHTRKPQDSVNPVVTYRLRRII
jgi:hypothetical protein